MNELSIKQFTYLLIWMMTHLSYLPTYLVNVAMYHKPLKGPHYYFCFSKGYS